MENRGKWDWVDHDRLYLGIRELMKVNPSPKVTATGHEAIIREHLERAIARIDKTQSRETVYEIYLERKIYETLLAIMAMLMLEQDHDLAWRVLEEVEDDLVNYTEPLDNYQEV